MRPLISSILILAICSLALGQPMPGKPSDWVPIDVSEVANDKVMQSRLDYGAKHMIKKGIEEGKLPDTQLEISRLCRVAVSFERGVNYKFDVELIDPEGNKYRIVYVVNYRSWDNVIKVTSYSFKPLPDSWEDPTFKKYYDPLKVVGDPYVAKLLEFGLQYIVDHPVPNSPDASYHIVRTHIVQHARGNPYRLWFLIDLENDHGPPKTLEIEFFDDPFLEKWGVNYYFMHHLLYVDLSNLEKVHLAFPRSLTPQEFEANEFNVKDHFEFAVNAALAEGIKRGFFSNPDYRLHYIWNASVDKVKGDNYTRLAFTMLKDDVVGTIVCVPMIKNTGEIFSLWLSILELHD